MELLRIAGVRTDERGLQQGIRPGVPPINRTEKEPEFVAELEQLADELEGGIEARLG